MLQKKNLHVSNIENSKASVRASVCPWQWYLPSHTSALQLCAGLVMIGVIIASRRVGINPDNVATPIAASLGDLITLSLLAGISTGLYKELGTKHTHSPQEAESVSLLLTARLVQCFASQCVYEAFDLHRLAAYPLAEKIPVVVLLISWFYR